ncbi:hypothetical protein D3C80_578130 [compost metagenome]
MVPAFERFIAKLHREKGACAATINEEKCFGRDSLCGKPVCNTKTLQMAHGIRGQLQARANLREHSGFFEKLY